MSEDFDIRASQSGKDRDSDFEKALRPSEFDSFSGQDKIIENLRVFVAAARMRGESLDHVLLHGPPGLGKTIRDSIDIMIDKGPGARSVQLSLSPFTLIGATTRSGLLTSPLRARFGINCHLEYYDHEVLERIVLRSARLLGVKCTAEAAHEIALRSRGTPRIANALLRRVRDFAQVKGSGVVEPEIARYALEALNIDRYGLDEIDNKILTTIITKFKGGPVGLTTIATALGEDPGTIEEVYEPFLIKEGFIKRTPRGREVTELAWIHLGHSPEGRGMGSLF